MTRPRFRLTPHTADVRLHVWGDTEQDLVAHAVAGTMRLALGREPRGQAAAWHRVERDERDVAARLVTAVNEALFLLYTRRCACVAMRWEAGHALLGAVPLRAGVEPEMEIKAATFHALRPLREARRLFAVLVLDV